MTTDGLAAALHACAAGLYALEAGTELLIANRAFLHRSDFTCRFIEHGTSITDGTTPMACIEWDAAITALHAGALPCSGGERRILQLAASESSGTALPPTGHPEDYYGIPLGQATPRLASSESPSTGAARPTDDSTAPRAEML